MTTDTLTESQTIELESLTASTIRNVTLYPARAEVTRVFKFAVNAAQTQVHIDGLPTIMDRESLRVDGVGDATIHDVTISNTPALPDPTSSTLKALNFEKERTQRALDRCKRSLVSLETLFGTMNIQHVDVANLSTIMRSYDTTGEELDEKVIELEAKMKEIEEKIKLETEGLGQGQKRKAELGTRVSVAVVASAAGDVELVVTYACKTDYKRYWRAGYDIRVDMSQPATHGKQTVTLVYKAIVTQSTGEPWENVPLTLDTTTPTYGAHLPILDTWVLQECSNYRYAKKMGLGLGGGGGSVKDSRHVSIDPRPNVSAQEEFRSETMRGTLLAYDSYDPTIESSAPAPAFKKLQSEVTSRGNVNATFRVPGFVTIPSASKEEDPKNSNRRNDDEHTFSITDLELDAVVTWATVPKKEPKVMFKAKIVNSSEYTLLNGKASVYVDRSFISQIDVPLVSPLESFDCPLGYDPTIRITYHPLRKQLTTSGSLPFSTKTNEHLFTQIISIQNTKSIPIPILKVVDQIPVSEVGGIKVRLINPGLLLPDLAAATTTRAGVVSAAIDAGPGNAEESQLDEQAIDHTRAQSQSQNQKSTNRLSVTNSYFASKSPTAAANTTLTNAHTSTSAAPRVKITGYSSDVDVIAQWEGTDEIVEVGDESRLGALERLGKDGMIEWVCRDVPPMKSTTAALDLVLQYEIKVPAKMDVRFSGVRGE